MSDVVSFRSFPLERSKSAIHVEAADVAQMLLDLGYGVGREAADVRRMDLESSEFKQILSDYQDFHGLTPDGELGFQTLHEMTAPRCGHPDIMPAEEAVGSGPWKRCHNVGEYHAVNVHFSNAPPEHLTQPYTNPQHPEVQTRWHEILRRTREAYRQIGLLIHWSGGGTGRPDSPGTPRISASFVVQNTNWIGLALLGNNNLGCNNASLWCQYQSRFQSNSTNAEAMIRVWVVLLLHEIAHNCGLGHTRGGIMNPSLLSLDAAWAPNDPGTPWMRSRFTGQPVPTDEPPKPDPPPDPGIGRPFTGYEVSTPRGRMLALEYNE